MSWIIASLALALAPQSAALAPVTPVSDCSGLTSASGFYSARYQAWCTAQGTVMTCQPSSPAK